jgi:hypothetical protein
MITELVEQVVTVKILVAEIIPEEETTETEVDNVITEVVKAVVDVTAEQAQVAITVIQAIATLKKDTNWLTVGINLLSIPVNCF